MPKTCRCSRIGLAIALIYSALAVAASLYDLLRAPGGDWLDLRGIETCIATLPACYVIQNLLPKLGLPTPDFYHRLESPYTIASVLVSIAACAALLYGITAWIERKIRGRKAEA
jgi:hypothetical protein